MTDKTVLVVEDDIQLSKALKIRLQAHGMDVLTATSGIHGFWKAAKIKPDAIITDYAMPNGDGESFLMRLKGDAVLKTIPVIVITGRTRGGRDATDLKSHMIDDQGASAFLTKPVDFDALLDTLRRQMALQA